MAEGDYDFCRTLPIPQFTVGQKVVCKYGTGYEGLLTSGKTYTISKVDGQFVYTTADRLGETASAFASRFEPARAVRKYAVGDFVRVLHSDFAAIEVGEVHQVVASRGTSVRLSHPNGNGSALLFWDNEVEPYVHPVTDDEYDDAVEVVPKYAEGDWVRIIKSDYSFDCVGQVVPVAVVHNHNAVSVTFEVAHCALWAFSTADIEPYVHPFTDAEYDAGHRENNTLITWAAARAEAPNGSWHLRDTSLTSIPKPKAVAELDLITAMQNLTAALEANTASRTGVIQTSRGPTLPMGMPVPAWAPSWP